MSVIPFINSVITSLFVRLLKYVYLSAKKEGIFLLNKISIKCLQIQTRKLNKISIKKLFTNLDSEIEERECDLGIAEIPPEHGPERYGAEQDNAEQRVEPEEVSLESKGPAFVLFTRYIFLFFNGPYLTKLVDNLKVKEGIFPPLSNKIKKGVIYEL